MQRLGGSLRQGLAARVHGYLKVPSCWRSYFRLHSFKEDWRLVMIVEVRSYRIKPGKRDEFIRLFEARAIEAQRSYGMKVTGPFLDVENPNKFVFLRSFPSLEERERMKDAFYGG